MKPSYFHTLALFLIILFSLFSLWVQLQQSDCEPFSSNYAGIDVIYYINLDHRTDRNTEFLEEMKKANVPPEKIQRISGVNKPNQGDLGCSMSHIKALNQFIQSNYETCIIFEDDFTFYEPEKVESRINDFVNAKVEYDVCLLAGNVQDKDMISYPAYSGIKQIKNVATTSGYLFSKKYANTLLANFSESVTLLEKSYKNGKPDKNNQPYAIDQYWKKLQSKDKWFLFFPKMGKQRQSYSDIMKGNVNYEV
jgi:hypothetical protein